MLGIAGNPIIATPNIDNIAKKGVRFTHTFVTTPICAASRASILTGLFERTHDFTFNKPPLQKAYMDISYPYLLKNAGYRTGFVGKFGVKLATSIDSIFSSKNVNGFPRPPPAGNRSGFSVGSYVPILCHDAADVGEIGQVVGAGGASDGGYEHA